MSAGYELSGGGSQKDDQTHELAIVLDALNDIPELLGPVTNALMEQADRKKGEASRIEQTVAGLVRGTNAESTTPRPAGAANLAPGTGTAEQPATSFRPSGLAGHDSTGNLPRENAKIPPRANRQPLNHNFLSRRNMLAGGVLTAVGISLAAITSGGAPALAKPTVAASRIAKAETLLDDYSPTITTALDDPRSGEASVISNKRMTRILDLLLLQYGSPEGAKGLIPIASNQTAWEKSVSAVEQTYTGKEALRPKKLSQDPMDAHSNLVVTAYTVRSGYTDWLQKNKGKTLDDYVGTFFSSQNLSTDEKAIFSNWGPSWNSANTKSALVNLLTEKDSKLYQQITDELQEISTIQSNAKQLG